MLLPVALYLCSVQAQSEDACGRSTDPQRVISHAYSLSRHTMQRSHGDICLDAVTQDFFCPFGCLHILEAPYCAHKTAGLPAEACRAPLTTKTRVDMLMERLSDLQKMRTKSPSSHIDNQIKLVKFDLRGAKAEAARNAASMEAEREPEPTAPAPSVPTMTAERACDSSRVASEPDMEWAKGLSATLEGHSTEPFHGDICRTDDGSFFCPESCEKSTSNPFCVASNKLSPCRISILDSDSASHARRRRLRGQG